MPNSQFSNRAFSLYALFSQYSSCNIHNNCFLQFSPQSRAFTFTGMVFEQEAHFVACVVASAPISSRFLCPRPPLLLSAPNQNRHATQATHFVDDIRHYLWLKSWFLCQVDKLRDIILIFLFTNFESKRLIQEMLYFVPTFFWETYFVLQHTDWLPAPYKRLIDEIKQN